MSNNIKNIIEWYDKYNGFNLVVKTQTKEFNININNNSLAHLLGLHYALQHNLKGYALYKFIKNKSDEKLYELIKNNNPNKLKSVKNRVKNFKYFMENLDEAVLYENTSKTTNLKSEFLLIKIADNKYLQLAIARDRVDTDYLETFVVDNKDRYIDGSKISENVVSIERYKKDKLIPFSFDVKKNEILLEDYKQNPNFIYQECLLKLEKNYEEELEM